MFISRLESESQFNLGRSTEITRDELKFTKFIQQLRTRFSEFFYDLLETQLRLKGIISKDEFEDIREDITFCIIVTHISLNSKRQRFNEKDLNFFNQSATMLVNTIHTNTFVETYCDKTIR